MASRCQYCSSLSIQRLVELTELEFSARTFPQHAFYQHHASFDDLEKSARKGCDFCELIVASFKGSGPVTGQYWPETWLNQDSDFNNSMYYEVKAMEVTDIKIAIDAEHLYTGETTEKACVFDTLKVQVGPVPTVLHNESDEDDSLSYLSLTLSVPRDKAIYVGKHRIGKFQLDPNLSSTSNYDVARAWLHQCEYSHQSCLRSKTPNLPTRVIDVGTVDGDTYKPPRVVLSEGTKAAYVSLSHCWGGPISTVLNTKTIIEFQKAIPWSLLPANFQDAITITRTIGFQYIWIDSLCIQQDSKTDWAKESAKMGLIYRNSAVTISAIASAGSESGILKNNSIMSAPHPSYLRAFDDDTVCNQVMVERKDYSCEDFRSLDHQAPLSRRGWTLQESVLSPRQLIFGNEQIYWKCPEGFQCADGLPPGNTTPDNSWANISSVLHSSILRQPNLVVPTQASLLNEYYRLVQRYSDMNLTFDSDKLPAFSGLASLLHTEIGSNYFAGLWSHDIINGLLWKGESSTSTHVQTYRAPSWSWAVTNEPILYPPALQENGKEEVLFLESSISLRDSTNPFGEVLSAELVVQGRTMPLKRSRQIISYFFPKDWFGIVDYDEPETFAEEMITTMLFIVQDGDDQWLLSIGSRYGTQEEWAIDNNDFYATQYLVLAVHAGEDSPHGSISAHGLVLRKVVGQPDGVYERAGLVEIRGGLEYIQTWQSQTLRLI